MTTRARLEALYGDERTEDGRVKAAKNTNPASRDELRKRKDQVLREMQAEYTRLKANWGGDNEYDGWFAHPINNAQLNSVAEYYDFVPAFEHILAANGGDLEKFYKAAERLSKKPKPERHEQLRILVRARSGSPRAERGRVPAGAG